MKVLRIGIECGEKTCASEPGKFCNYCSTRNWGQEFYCHIFEMKLIDEMGWLQRCNACLLAEEFH